MSKISKEADRINLDHLSGDARKYVEYLISSKEIVDQDQVMILCEIMKEAQDESIVNAFSYVLEQSEKRMNQKLRKYLKHDF